MDTEDANTEVASALTDAAALAGALPQLTSRLCQLAKLTVEALWRWDPTYNLSGLRASVKSLQAACLRLHDAWSTVAAGLRDVVGFGRMPGRQSLGQLEVVLLTEAAAAASCEAAALAVLGRLAETAGMSSSSLAAGTDQLGDLSRQLGGSAAELGRLAGGRAVLGDGRLPEEADERLRRVLGSCGGLEAGEDEAAEEAAEVDDALSARLRSAMTPTETVVRG